MLLHLCEDEKFIDHVIDTFETVAPCKNIYYIQPSQKNDQLKLVKTKHPNIVSVPVESKEFKNIINNIKTYDAVILHCYQNPYKTKVVREAPPGVHFHWMCWGSDLYSIPALSKNLLLKQTKKYILDQLGLKGRIRTFLYENCYSIFAKIFQLKNKTVHPIIEQIRSFQKIHSVSTVIPSDFELIKKYISSQMVHIPYKYGTLETLLEGHYDTTCSGENFLVGNSAYVSNNHLEIIKELYKIDLTNIKIYLPMSYGNEQYAEFIETKGKKILKENFFTLKKFLPLEEYNQILNTCGNVVMNHTRQQAMGNIIMSLWKGARVFLNRKNPAFHFFKDEGFRIFEINEIKNYRSLPDFKELASHNRPFLKKIYSRDKVIEETQVLVNYLSKKKNYT
jgi:dTDP-N-acetylfucosamine:lipid II N-acetylfucosaminyltransferase